MHSATAIERGRLDDLKSYGILDTPPEANFDRLARLAAHICATPIAVLTLIDEDRQWFKAVVGLDFRETGRSLAFCAYAIQTPYPLLVPDTHDHSLFADNPLVVGAPHIRFYTGIPLISPRGHALGALAVMDTVPRTLDTEQMDALETIAEQVMMQLELRRQRRELERQAAEREQKKTEELLALNSDMLAAITGSLAAYVEHRDWKQAFGCLLRCALAQTNSEYGFIGVVLDNSRLRVLAFEGVIWDKQVNRAFFDQAVTDYEQLGYLEFPRLDTLFGRAVTTGQVIIANDPAADPRAAGRPDGHPPMHNFMGVPIGAGQKVQGIVALANRPGGYSTADKQRIKALVQHASGLCESYQQQEQANLLEQERLKAEAALRESETRFRELAENIQDVFYNYHPHENRMLYISPAYEKIWARSCDSLYAQPLSYLDAIHEEDRPRAEAAHLRNLAGDMTDIEYRIFRHGSEQRWIRDYTYPILNADGAVERIVGTARDITSRKRLEAFKTEQMAILERVVAGAPLAEVLHATVRLVQSQYPDYLCSVLLVDNGRLQHGAAPSLPAAFVRAVDGSLLDPDAGPCASAVLTRQTVVIDDIAADPRWPAMRDLILAHGLAACWSIPILASTSEVLGTFAVYARAPRTPRPAELDLVSSCSHIVGIAIERKRAEQQILRSNRALRMLSACNELLIHASNESALLNDICQLTVDIGGYRMAWVGYALDDEDKSIVPAAHAGDEDGYLSKIRLTWRDDLPAGQGPAGQAIRTGRVATCEDIQQQTRLTDWPNATLEHGFRSVICLPLRQEQRTFGLLILYSTEVRAVSAEEVKLLQELADDLAFGIHNIRAQLERQRLQNAVLKVAAGVSATTGTAFFEQLACNMAEALGAQAGFVTRLLPGQPVSARTIIAVVDGQVVDNFDYPLAGTPCEHLLENETWTVTDRVVEQFPAAPRLAELGMRAYVGRRLDNSAGQPLGQLFVLFRSPLLHTDFISSTLQIFAARAAAELERQEADARIREQASLLDKAQDAIIVRDLDHRILFWNKGAERLYGWTAAEAIGNSIETLIHGTPEEFQAATRRVMDQGEWTGELSERHKRGHLLTIEGHWTLVRDDAGRPQSIFAINTNITQRKAAESEIQHLAFYDSLTLLPNRLLLLDRLQQALANSARTRQIGALVFVDLDNFKTLNDTLGHDKGDALLQQVALRLEGSVRENDTVARVGGDEFVLMLEGLSENPIEAAAQARALGEKVLATFNRPFHLDGYEYFGTPSLGVTLFHDQRDNVSDLLKRADLAMYQAKAAGRNAMRFFDPAMQLVVSARAELEADMRLGMQQQEFLLYYQPQVDAHGRMTGAEALIRWRHSRRGLVSPAEFIPLAEDTGLIVPLGQWVVETACQQLAVWAQRPETAHLYIAVNVSARQFRHPDFVDQVLRTIEASGANPQRLKLELTESLLVDSMEDTIAKMTMLKARGVGFSLDDFGTGYSSLYYLKRLPLDQLKIDQSFVRDVLTDPNDAAIARIIVTLGQSLGLAVIAEGVETEAQRHFLAQQGCHAYQGYLFSRPLAPEHLEAFVTANC